MDKKLVLETMAIMIVGLLLVWSLNGAFHRQYVLTHNERLGVDSYIGNVYAFKNDVLIDQEHNNMTNVGDDAINQRLFDTGYAGAVWKYIAIGTGDGSGTGKASTALATETDRQIGVYYVPADAQWGLNYTFSFASSVTIKEAGLFNASSTGNMAFYVWTLSVAVTSADTLKICWKGTTSGY
jgi:hypothetical protein